MSEEYAVPAAGCVQDGTGRPECPSSPAEARTAVRRVAGGLRARGAPCDETCLCDALLVASELTTNAMLHGGGMTGFDVEVVEQGLRVSVSDRSDERPVTLAPVDARGRKRIGGHGWPVVCRLARAVHVSRLPSGGKRITAVVPLR